jgi:pimeloyl-ACP methyl ester carboxylesterase
VSEWTRTDREAATEQVHAGVNLIRRGADEPLVLLHGIGHRWQAWLPIMDELAAHHEVIAIDLPGFGASPVPPDGMPSDMARSVAGIATFLAGEGLDRPHVAGNSLGGAIALELAVAGFARSATAFSPAGFFTAREVRRAMLILKTMRASSFVPATVTRATLRGSIDPSDLFRLSRRSSPSHRSPHRGPRRRRISRRSWFHRCRPGVSHVPVSGCDGSPGHCRLG